LKEDALPRLNLEHQRKRARILLKSVRAGDPVACALVSRHTDAQHAGLALHDAQLVVARANGFASWARLKQHISSERSEHPLALAARVAAANRAVETARHDALYRDPLAHDLAGDGGWAAWRAMRRTAWPGYAAGPDPYLTIVTKFFDDAVVRVVHDCALTQVVIIGAGTDTRAFRLDWPPGIRVFEVDVLDVLEHKEHVVQRHGARPRCERRVVDVTCRGSLTHALSRQGFDPSRRTAFLLERLHCLQPEAADRLVREVTAAAEDGSWIGVALIANNMLRARFLQQALRKLESIGLPSWGFGVDDPDAWLRARGWSSQSVVVGADEANYGRWPRLHVPRGSPALPHAFLAVGWRHDATTDEGAGHSTSFA
jgi:methyltransferase (TIGR00027 family)